MKSTFRPFAYSLLLILILSVSSPLMGQLQMPSLPSGEPDSVMFNRINAVAVNRIPSKIEETEETIKNGEKKILPKRDIIKIDSLLPIYVRFLKEKKKSAKEFIKANPNRQKIDHLINKWDGYYGQLNAWQNTVNSHEDNNLDNLTPFRELEYMWSLTLELAKTEKAPPSIINNVKRTLKDVTAIKNAIIKENNKLLTLETEITEHKGLVNETIDEFYYLLNSEVYNVFYHRHAALWKASFKNSKKDKEGKVGIDSIKNIVVNVGNYANENIRNIISYFFLSILFILFFIYFKKQFLKVKFTEEDAALQKAKGIIVDHTISGLVFSLTIMAIFYFSNIPYLLGDILLMTALISSVPMLQSVMYKRFKNVLFYIILFFVLNTLKTYVWFPSFYYRLYLLSESILAIFIVFSFSHPFMETRKMNTKIFGKILIYSIPVLYTLFGISILSNLFGYTNLTDLMLKVATLSCVLTMLFYAILMVISGLSIGGLHLIFTKQKNYNEERKLLVEKRTIQVIRIIVSVWWSFYFLGLIDLREPLTLWFNDILIHSYNFGSVSFTLGEIITFIIVLSSSFLLSNFISMIVDSGTLSFIKLPKGVPAAISLVLRYFIIAFGFVLALSALGVDLGSFNLMAGALGLGIGFGLQTIISNFVSGLILVFERPILPGDTVEVQNLLGKVTNIGVRSSKVRTFDGAEVIVPNNNLISNDLINWTLSDSVKRLEIKISAAYGSDPNIVLDILNKEAIKNEFSLSDPEPRPLFDQFGDSSLDFRLLVWVPYEKGLLAKSLISVGIYNAFKENGIEIPFPQRDIHIKEKVDKGEIKEIPPKTFKSKSPKDVSIPPSKAKDSGGGNKE